MLFKSCDAAAQEGLDIYIGSDYRDYAYQVKIYNNYCNLYGWEQADSFSARPGYSEHQTGLTIDCNTIDDAFGDTQESVWLAQHCADYGFIIRFPKGKESITGYQYEPWHIRYVGVDVAKEIQKYGLTLEEYLGVDSVYAEPWQG
ncbi:MAG: D-alanyl-D-alanine carboxypeptidase family protein [Ruminococcus sp.]